MREHDQNLSLPAHTIKHCSSSRAYTFDTYARMYSKQKSFALLWWVDVVPRLNKAIKNCTHSLVVLL